MQPVATVPFITTMKYKWWQKYIFVFHRADVVETEQTIWTNIKSVVIAAVDAGRKKTQDWETRREILTAGHGTQKYGRYKRTINSNITQVIYSLCIFDLI